MSHHQAPRIKSKAAKSKPGLKPGALSRPMGTRSSPAKPKSAKPCSDVEKTKKLVSLSKSVVENQHPRGPLPPPTTRNPNSFTFAAPAQQQNRPFVQQQHVQQPLAQLQQPQLVHQHVQPHLQQQQQQHAQRLAHHQHIVEQQLIQQYQQQAQREEQHIQAQREEQHIQAQREQRQVIEINAHNPRQINIAREPYAHDILVHLRLSQERTPPIVWTLHQNISAMMRVVLVDWLIEVAHEYHLHEQTLFLCIIYLDRCLATYPVEKNRLQLLGISCLFLASKMEEVIPPPLKEFSYITDFTYDSTTILLEEDRILDTLDWNLSYVTVHDFITTFLAYYHLVDVDKTHFANYLSLLSLTSLELYQRYLSSELAWAMVLLTAYTFDATWPLDMHIRMFNPYVQTQDDYPTRRACVLDLHHYITTMRANNLHVQAAQQKYAKSVYGFVSNRSIPPLAL